MVENFLIATHLHVLYILWVTPHIIFDHRACHMTDIYAVTSAIDDEYPDLDMGPPLHMYL